MGSSTNSASDRNVDDDTVSTLTAFSRIQSGSSRRPRSFRSNTHDVPPHNNVVSTRANPPMYAIELSWGTRFAEVMRSWIAHGTEPVTVVAWGNTTPFGTPVVPEVNIT